MSTVEQPHPPQLVLSGEIDIASAAELREAGIRAVGGLAEGVQLQVDLAKVTFVDSAGLGALIAIRNAAASFQHEIILTNIPPSIMRLFELTGLSSSFTLLPRPE